MTLLRDRRFYATNCFYKYFHLVLNLFFQRLPELYKLAEIGNNEEICIALDHSTALSLVKYLYTDDCKQLTQIDDILEFLVKAKSGKQ